MPEIKIGSSAWETTNDTGTGNVALNGARSGYDTFVTSIGVGNYTGYTIRSEVSNEYEVGFGQVSTGSLSRTEILHSSNGGAAINLTSDLHEVVSTIPAETLQNMLMQHRGSSAPTWFTDGMEWLDDSGYPIICEKIYNSSTSSWLTLACTDATTGLPINPDSGDDFFLINSGETFPPTPLGVGDVFYNTLDGMLYIWNGTDWAAIDATNIVTQNLSPSNTQLTWVDDSTGIGNIWPVSIYIDGNWVDIGAYDSANMVWITNVPAATETVAGIAEIATQLEVNDGLDDSRIVTPLKLKDNLAPNVITSLNISYQGAYAVWNDFLVYWNGAEYQVPAGTVLQVISDTDQNDLYNNTTDYVDYASVNITPYLDSSKIVIDASLATEQLDSGFIHAGLEAQLRRDGTDIGILHRASYDNGLNSTDNLTTNIGMSYEEISGTVSAIDYALSFRQIVFASGGGNTSTLARQGTLRVMEIA